MASWLGKASNLHRETPGKASSILMALYARGMYDTNEVDLRHDDSEETFRLLHSHRLAAAAVIRDEIVGDPNHPLINVLAANNNDIHQWYACIENEPFLEDFLPVENWAGDMLMHGYGLVFDVNIHVYNRARNELGRHIDHADRHEALVLNYHVDHLGNGVHFDLQYNSDFTDFDAALWPLGTNPHTATAESIDFMGQMLRLPVNDLRSHFGGAFAILPQHLLQDRHSCERIAGRFPPAFHECIRENGFRSFSIPEEWFIKMHRQSRSALKKVGHTTDYPGSVYIRASTDTVQNHRRICEDHLANGFPSGFRHARGFLQRFLGNMPPRRVSDSTTPSTCMYIGETSKGDPRSRWAQEDNPNHRDGAGLQWEIFQLLGGVTFQFVLAFVQPEKKWQSCLLEAITAGMFETATAHHSGQPFSMLGRNGNGCLNQLNCGVPFFLQLGKRIPMRFIVTWFINFSRDLRDVRFLDSTSERDIPSAIFNYFAFHQDAILEWANQSNYVERDHVVNSTLTLAHITVYIVHQFLTGQAVRKAAAKAGRTLKEHMEWVASHKDPAHNAKLHQFGNLAKRRKKNLSVDPADKKRFRCIRERNGSICGNIVEQFPGKLKCSLCNKKGMTVGAKLRNNKGGPICIRMTSKNWEEVVKDNDSDTDSDTDDSDTDSVD